MRMLLLPLLYLCSVFSFGVFTIRMHDQLHEPEELILSVFPEDMLLFHGGVLSDRSTRGGHRMARIRIDSVHIQGLPTWHRTFLTDVLIRQEPRDAFPVSYDPSTANDEAPSGDSSADTVTTQNRSFGDAPEDLFRASGTPFSLAGAYLRFGGNLEPPSRPVNPNQFDYASHLARQGIHSTIFAIDIESIGESQTAPPWHRLQISMQQRTSMLFSEHTRGIARAIMLGDRSELDSDLRMAFSRAGLAHLMAVSGMHVGFILLPVWLLLPWFRGSVSGKWVALLFCTALLAAYAGATGFSVSVNRASIMALFLIIARLFHRPGASLNILGAAALLLLIYDPRMLFDVGFQLSFTAVAIILTTLPGTRYLLPVRYRYRRTGALFQFVMVSVLVQAGLYPLLIHYFNEFSMIGPLSNTLAVPFVQAMFLWSFACLFIGMIDTSIAHWLNIPADYVLQSLISYVTLAGTLPGAWIEGKLASHWIFGVWFFGTSVIASLRIPQLRWKMLSAFLFFLVLLQGSLVYEKQLRRPVLDVTFLDVGQGDAILIETPGRKKYLYDVGVWTPQFDSGERVLLPELKARGIRRLDGIILSHPHADHIGGIMSIIESVPVDTIYQSPAPHDSQLYHRYMARAAEIGIPVRLLESGDLIHTDPSLPMMVFAPSPDIQARDPNNQSVVIMVQYGRNRILLTGDAEKEAEAFLSATYGAFLRADILKIGHHASRTSSTEPFLAHANPAYGIASLGLRNRYRHPHREAIERLHQAGIRSRFTSLEGAIHYRCDGVRCNLQPWQSGNDKMSKRPVP
ncbi:DNA internalization-related competence protein ComEC/Rec2 [Balneolales bacterium ANBcel1]|nr:DNA internalization-related competence protein ComEC/Rec2 [Balneolales bacterium ANBcel1]